MLIRVQGHERSSAFVKILNRVPPTTTWTHYFFLISMSLKRVGGKGVGVGGGEDLLFFKSSRLISGLLTGQGFKFCR